MAGIEIAPAMSPEAVTLVHKLEGPAGVANTLQAEWTAIDGLTYVAARRSPSEFRLVRIADGRTEECGTVAVDDLVKVITEGRRQEAGR
jgi:hypothetical protein